MPGYSMDSTRPQPPVSVSYQKQLLSQPTQGQVNQVGSQLVSFALPTGGLPKATHEPRAAWGTTAWSAAGDAEEGIPSIFGSTPSGSAPPAGQRSAYNLFGR
ncbi:MAG: hypothetical protein SFZ03_07570 [Candidatus Melainabacteria bacterium]|nr:hypothetical protein [Candidatus Melainabacteria bacterium]